MEKGIKLIDFETVDSMVQVHGACADAIATSLIIMSSRLCRCESDGRENGKLEGRSQAG